MQCPNCATENAVRFCRCCGTTLAPVAQKQCGRCAQSCRASAKFCTHCGAAFSGSPPSPAPTMLPPASPRPAAPVSSATPVSAKPAPTAPSNASRSRSASSTKRPTKRRKSEGIPAPLAFAFFLALALLAGYGVYNWLSQKRIDAINERSRLIEEGPSPPAAEPQESEERAPSDGPPEEGEAITPISPGEPSSEQRPETDADWLLNLRRELQTCFALSSDDARVCRDNAYLKYCFPDQRWGTVPECPKTDPFSER